MYQNAHVIIFGAAILLALVHGSSYAEDLDLTRAKAFDWAEKQHGGETRAHTMLAPTDDQVELVSLLKTYAAMGGEQLQVNVVGAETLRLALEDPEQYRDLVVRVAGFTAYFVTLTPSIQREIVARTEAEF